MTVNATHYTPNDLQNLVFKKSAFRGYSEDAVNEVMDKIIEDYNSYIHENIELKDKIMVLNEAIQHYKDIEESLQNTLVIAQQTAQEIIKNAYDKSENIVKEAELKAHQKISEANEEVTKVKFQYDEINRKVHVFKTKSETLVFSLLEALKQMVEDKE